MCLLTSLNSLVYVCRYPSYTMSSRVVFFLSVAMCDARLYCCCVRFCQADISQPEENTIHCKDVIFIIITLISINTLCSC